MTATAIFGCCAGAKATNQASECSGFVEFGPSSAVPVLPATCTPGVAAAVPAPERTTWIIIERTSWATLGISEDRLWDDGVDRGDSGLHSAAVERDRRADAGHLERCREIAILADRGSPNGEVVA